MRVAEQDCARPVPAPAKAGPPKVVHIITRIDRGGSAEVVLDIAARQRAAGHDVTLVIGQSVDPHEDPDAYAQRTGVSVIRVDALRREIAPLAEIRALVALYNILRKLGPDVAHTHTSKAGILGRTAAWLAGIPAIVHSPHGHIFYGYYGKAKTWFFIQAERWVARVTDCITTLTDLGAQDHVRLRVATADKFATRGYQQLSSSRKM